VATIVATGYRNQGVRPLGPTRSRVLQKKYVRDGVTRDKLVEEGADMAGVTSDRILKLDRPEVLPICIGSLDALFWAAMGLCTSSWFTVHIAIRRKGCIQTPDSVGSDCPLAMLEPICTAWTSSIFRAGYDPNCDDSAAGFAEPLEYPLCQFTTGEA
jgi:hypothetical protein